MPQEKLHQTLSELHKELEGADAADEAAVEHLKTTMGDIQGFLDRAKENAGENAEDSDSSLVDRLGESGGHFEQSHPNVAFAIRRVLEALGNMGI